MSTSYFGEIRCAYDYKGTTPVHGGITIHPDRIDPTFMLGKMSFPVPILLGR